MARMWKPAFFAVVVSVLLVSSGSPRAQSATPQVLANFSAEGGGPQAKLLVGSDGNLYGTTCNGGRQGAGSIFRVAPDGSGFTTVHTFPGGGAQVCPISELIQSSGDGLFYGTTSGGSGFEGTIFRVDGMAATDTAEGFFETLHSFSAFVNGDGEGPSGLVEVAGAFYGTTIGGGAFGGGTVFRMDASDPYTVTLLHSFDPSSQTDGASPRAALVDGGDGYLYGTTTLGGVQGWGTVFRIDTAGTDFSVIHDMANGGGIFPQAPLLKIGTVLLRHIAAAV